MLYHSNTMWKLRGHPALVETMAAVYDYPPEKMCVSFDTLGIRYSPEYISECVSRTIDMQKKNNYREHYSGHDMDAHIDQRFEYEFHETYQGLYAFTATPSHKDGGFVLYPGTHHLHGATLQECLSTAPQRDFLIYPENFFNMFPDSIPVHIPVTEGEYVIWDSRLLHYSIHIDEKRDRRSSLPENATLSDWWRLNRMVAYLCYHPGEEMGYLDTVKEGLRSHIYELYSKGWGTNHSIHRPRVIEIPSKTPTAFLSEYHSSLACIPDTTASNTTESSDSCSTM
jgi:hypothetical protein